MSGNFSTDRGSLGLGASSLLPDGRRVLVVGLSRSGLAAARALTRLGFEVTGTESAASLPPEVEQELRSRGVRLELGGHSLETFLAADWILLSPGVPPSIEPLARARTEGRPVLGELELAFRLCQASTLFEIPFAAITGTNGKSTTTTMLSHILETAGREHLLGGNIGVPLVDCLDPLPPLVLVEVSSFQLETIQTFRPRVGAILNLAPDHLDRYPDFESYVEAKAQLCRNMGQGDCLVYNADDPLVLELLPRWPHLQKHGFSRSQPVADGTVLERGVLCLAHGAERTEVLPATELPVAGVHNIENALAAMAMADALSVPPEIMARALRTYRSLPHRCELVGQVGGVRFYDDSKGTNVGATLMTLRGFTEPIVLIAGGKAKGDDYTPLAQELGQRARHVVLIGEAREAIASALGSRVPHEGAATLEEATALAFRRAQPGDAVVLSPACSSFDMFRDYHHRGQLFQQAVAELAAAAGEQPPQEAP
jgi:UDP-N-acetylmuramoylalanine--D-glutamate ligase